MSSSRPPPAITYDLSRRPGESVYDHLARVGVSPRRDIPGHPAPSGGAGDLTEEQIAAMRAEAYRKLRPPRRKKGPKP